MGDVVKRLMASALFVPFALAACTTPPVPDSGAGVGFSEYSQYEIERARLEAQQGTALPPGASQGQGIVTPTGATTVLPDGTVVVQTAAADAVTTNDLANAGIGAPLSATGAIAPGSVDPNTVAANDALRTAGVQASPGNANPVQIASTGISDEQDFDAVASRETIESDAERRAQQQAAYQVIQPTALPERDGSEGPNIVEYALNAPNQVGQEWYSRSLLVIDPQGKFQRNCAVYRSADEAQRDFLVRGGPERDPRGLDPDGDGFACGWDPTPFRVALAGN